MHSAVPHHDALLSVFASDAVDRVRAIERLVNGIDERTRAGELPLGLLDELREEAHRLRGGAAVVGLDQIRAGAAALELAAKDAAEGIVDLDAPLILELRRQAEAIAAGMESLPAAPAVAGETAAPPARAAGTVVAIEDEPTNQALMARLIEQRPGVRLVTAATGEEGLRLIRADPPGLVLLDLNLPDVGGEALLRTLRNETPTNGLPIVILSADAATATRERLLAAGATAYVVKPITTYELLGFVDEFCGEGEG
jgi:CheY-like chemotaxis protein